jgi:hypothetical protein
MTVTELQLWVGFSVCVGEYVCMSVNQRLDVCRINCKFISRDSENCGNNIRKIHKLKIFS